MNVKDKYIPEVLQAIDVIRSNAVNDSVAVLPASSVALHFTSVSPTGNTEPEGGSQEIVILPPTSSCVIVVPSSSSVALPSTLSSAVTEYLTLAPSVA